MFFSIKDERLVPVSCICLFKTIYFLWHWISLYCFTSLIESSFFNFADDSRCSRGGGWPSGVMSGKENLFTAIQVRAQLAKQQLQSFGRLSITKPVLPKLLERSVSRFFRSTSRHHRSQDLAHFLGGPIWRKQDSQRYFGGAKNCWQMRVLSCVCCKQKGKVFILFRTSFLI